jgi:Uma2 family endonuclease
MGAPIEDTAIGRDALIERWRAMLADPALANLPYRIELNKWGRIEMAPLPSPRHMDIAALLAGALRRDLGGKAFQECAILTRKGVLGADVVWCSSEFVARHAAVFKSGDPLLEEAPEICVEIKSPSNSLGELKEKIDAYLAAGAIEAWIVLDDLSVRFFNVAGEHESSRFGVDLDLWRKEAG